MVHNGFEQEWLIDIMTEIGYIGIKSKTFYSESKIFMGNEDWEG